MPLTNCKLELKLTWTNLCVLSAAGNNNVNGNDDDENNINFTIKDTQLYALVVTVSANYQNSLSKDFKDHFIGINIKQVKIKIRQINIAIFSN